MLKSSTLIPCLAVVGSIVSLCVGTSFGKQLFPAVGPQGTASLRVIIASLILLAVRQPWRHSLSLKDGQKIALFGLIVGSMNVCFYTALETLPLGIAIAIEFTGPLTVAIISSHKPLDFLWILLAALGLAFLLPIAPGAVALNPVGVIFAFVAAVLWGLYIIVGKWIGHLPAGQTTSLAMFTAALALTPFAFINVGAKILDPHIFLAGLLVAIGSTAIPYSLEMFALKRLPKNTFSILLSMEPAVGALGGMIILHETLTFLQWCAICSVMLASIGSAMTAKPKVAAEADLEEQLPADILG